MNWGIDIDPGAPGSTPLLLLLTALIAVFIVFRRICSNRLKSPEADFGQPFEAGPLNKGKADHTAAYGVSRYESAGRVIVLLFFGIFLLDPHLVRKDHEPPLLIVLSDDSKSMYRPQKTAGSPKENAESFLQETAVFLNDKYRVENRKLSEFSPEGSPLGDWIEDALEKRPAAIVLLSDGIPTRGTPLSEAARSAKKTGVPIFAAAFGSERPPFDLRIELVEVPGHSFLGDLISMQAMIRTAGNDTPITAAVRLDEIEEGGESKKILKRIAARDLKIDSPGTPGKVRFDFIPGLEGRHRYRLSAETHPAKKEWNPLNNECLIDIIVHKDRLRVLLIEQSPRYEYRFLRELLRREPAIELKTLLLEAAPEQVRQDSTAVSKSDLNSTGEFDLAILGDVDPESLGNALLSDLTEQFENHKLSLLVIAGERFSPNAYMKTPIGRLLPFESDETGTREPGICEAAIGTTKPFPVEFRPESAEYIFDVERQKGLEINWMMRLKKLKPGTTVYADCAGSPLICASKIGQNLLLWHGTDETWRWKKDGFYRDFWMETLRFLVRNRSIPANEIANRKPQQAENDTTSEDDVASRKNERGELDDLAMNRPALEEVAIISGGKFIESTANSDWIKSLPPGNPEVKIAMQYPFPGRIPCMVLILMILAAIWSGAKRRAGVAQKTNFVSFTV